MEIERKEYYRIRELVKKTGVAFRMPEIEERGDIVTVFIDAKGRRSEVRTN